MTKAKIVIDLGFGDAGKGSIVDFFVEQYKSDLVIRFNGGTQAAHNVVTENQHHTFRQFGSGSFRGARTLYSKYALFDPLMLLEEGRGLAGKGVVNPFDNFYVEEDCVITTIFQQAMNRIRETLRSDGRHGSCGMGIGETASDIEEIPHLVLRVKDLKDRTLTYLKLKKLREFKLKEFLKLSEDLNVSHLKEHLDVLQDEAYDVATADAYCNIVKSIHVITNLQAIEMLDNSHNPIFEGAQGVLLDQDYGFYPYITRSQVAPCNAVSMCKEASIDYEVTGLVRAYTVRHGPGPMPTFDDTLTRNVKDLHNKFGEWQRDFRVGYFDAVMTRLAIDICSESYGGTGVDNLFITCTDRLYEFEQVRVCNGYTSPEKSFFLSPYSLKSIGKEEKRKQTEIVSSLIPLYQNFFSTHKKSSVEYQLNYARWVFDLIGRNIKLLGISRGVKAEDKMLFWAKF